MKKFELAGASVIGRDHRRLLKPNQDAFHYVEEEDLTIAVVSDGCGSGRKSQVGAEVGVRLITQAIQDVARMEGSSLRWGNPLTSPLEEVRRRVLHALSDLVCAMGGVKAELIIQYFLFTLVGVILTEDEATFFSLGDGVIVVNDEVIPLGPFPNNAPPYVAYGLLDTSLTRIVPERLRLQITRVLPVADLNRFALLTDGGNDLWSTGYPINSLWEDDLIYRNPDILRRRLATLNGELRHANRGPLTDDTTLIVGRCRKEVEHAGSILER